MAQLRLLLQSKYRQKSPPSGKCEGEPGAEAIADVIDVARHAMGAAITTDDTSSYVVQAAPTTTISSKEEAN